MKRRLLFFVLFILFAGSSSYAAELNIYASGLRLHGATPAEQVTDENQVHIDYFLNAPADELKFLVLDASTGDELTSVTIPAGTDNANYTKGAHTNVVVDLSGFYGNDETYKWAIKATGSTVNDSFTKVFEHGTTLKRLFATIDNSPESDYMGRIYMENRSGAGSGKAYIINADLTDKSNGLYGMAKLQSASRPSVDAEGYVWWADYGDTHGGLWVMNPSTLTTTAFFNGTQASSGVWTNGSSVEMGSSSSGCHVYASGSSTKVFMVNEDAGSTLPANGYVVFNVGQSNGSILRSWNVAPSQKVTVADNAGGNFSIVGTSHGAFLCQHRSKDANSSGARSLMFYDNNGTRRYNSTDVTYINGSNGGGMAVSKDETKLIMVNGDGNILLFDISWSGDVPTLTYNTTYTTPNAISGIGSLNFDYAGNIVATGGTYDSSMKLYIFSTPKANNTCTTPAASSRTIVLGSYIPPTPVTGVELNETTKTLVKGQNFTLTATIAPDDATNKNVTWESSDPTVASVSNGVVTALKKGTATITVKSADNETITASCDVTVDLLHGTYNIGGASAHYASLSAAATAIRTIGIDGDVTLLVCDDIAENANIGLVNNTDYSITIRPDAAVKRTITFGSQADNAGPSGHLMIGYDLTGWAASAAKNIYIDGSYNDEGQYLEFRAGSEGGIVACFYGHVTNSYIKNCRLINTRESGTNIGVALRVEQLTGGTPTAANKTDNSPENIGIENCYIQISGRDVNSNGIQFNGANAKTAGTGYPTDCYIRGCEIHARQRGIHLNGSNNVTIEGNTFHIQFASTGYLANAILGGSATGMVSVKSNKFIDLVTANKNSGNYGMQAIAASGGATMWEIENNYFAGMGATASTDNNSQLVYLRCGDPCTVRHNTFYMPSLSNKPATALTSANPIACVHLAGSNTYVVKNNIFVSEETVANNSLIRGTINATYVNNNIYFHSGGNAAIMAGAETYMTTWAEFTTKDAGSKWAEPVFSNAATGDLGIVEANDDLKVARLNDILTDLFGNDRNDPTYAGACEPVGVTNITGIPTTKTLDEIGDSYAFTATVLPDNTSFPTITWTSNNEAAVTVTSAGVITAQGQGEATITAIAGGFSVTCVVTVTAAHSLAGEYRIGGANADYTTLHAACADLCEYGLVGDATFLICADLSETANSGIVNNSDYTLTIRPDGNTKRTITFNNSADNKGPSGNMMIGCTNATLVSTDATQQWLSNDTRNIIIDGSYNGEGQYLEFKGGNVGGVIAVFYGNVTNSVIRNCRFISTRTTKTAYIAHFRTQKESDRKPVGVGFENCYMESTKTAETQVVYFNGSQSSTATGKPTNCYLRGCEIVSNLRGVFFNGAINATIEGNTFRMPSASSGYLTHAIMGNAQTGIITVRENKFTELKTTNTSAGSYGIRAITAAGGATKWVIENNYFDDLDATDASAAGKNMLLTYIWCSDLCEIRHNTFHMPSLTNKPSTTLDSGDPIACIRITGTKAHIIQNNLFVSEETAAYNSLISGTLPSAVSGNVFYHAGTNAAVTPSATTFDDLAATYKENNKWQQVAFSETYKPAAAYTGNINLIVAQIEGIDHDIEGNERGDITHVGCYEYPLALTFAETSDANTEILDMIDGITADVTLQRTFSADVPWYTLVLPFDVSAEQMQAIFGSGYRVAKLEDAYMKTANALLLRFADHTAIEAGVPCLFHTGQDINEDIVFHNVTIDAADPDYTIGVVTLHGLYDRTTVEANEANFYLGTGSYLYPYSTDILTNAFRAYFNLSAIPNPSSCSARIVFQEDAATEMDETIAPDDNTVQKVIRDGQLLIIRNGQEYTIDGRLREVR